ncbi:hypothetical protein ACFW0S_11970 [Citrobacter freundii]|uniref:hypothetical protein n=1 Tax=Citrobacter freundii TaxID=546 RepID=UPI00366FB3D3
MGKMTFVFEYEDGKEPPVSAADEFMGGRSVSAALYDYRDDFFTEEQKEAITEMLEESEWHDHIEQHEAEAIMKKVESLTY